MLRDPMQSVWPEFFQEDLVIAVGDTRLAGRLISIGPRDKIRRDEITGEELPVAEAKARDRHCR